MLCDKLYSLYWDGLVCQLCERFFWWTTLGRCLCDRVEWSKRTTELGFSLHAATRVPAADRTRLERLCRYVNRPPLAAGRLQILDAQSLAFDLKTPWTAHSPLVSILRATTACQLLTPMALPPPTVAARPRRNPSTRCWPSTWRPSYNAPAHRIGSCRSTSRRSCAHTLNAEFSLMGSCGCGARTAAKIASSRSRASDAPSARVVWDGGWRTPPPDSPTRSCRGCRCGSGC